ncbi:MAG: alpha/beta hydrolase, partial [Theionarchaea archaeon]|nr:alpha/beta hydrolase [Theionarchaea archaeon]
MILEALGIIIGIIILYLVAIIFLPVLSQSEQPIHAGKSETDIVPKSRNDVTFTVEETLLRAWLYLPQKSSSVPCIIMSNGFGGTKGMILEEYALKFVEAGMAVLGYDYRYFGESEGEPRQLFSIADQLEDLKAAIYYVRNRKVINPEKIALWGTSAAGGF